MERLTKSERIGLLAFAGLVVVFFAVSSLVGRIGGGDSVLSHSDSLKLEAFRIQIAEMEADTVVKKAKHRDKENNDKMVEENNDENPLYDKLPRK